MCRAALSAAYRSPTGCRARAARRSVAGAASYPRWESGQPADTGSSQRHMPCLAARSFLNSRSVDEICGAIELRIDRRAHTQIRDFAEQLERRQAAEARMAVELSGKEDRIKEVAAFLIFLIIFPLSFSDSVPVEHFVEGRIIISLQSLQTKSVRGPRQRRTGLQPSKASCANSTRRCASMPSHANTMPQPVVLSGDPIMKFVVAHEEILQAKR